jgi:hypothetical protein
LGASFLAPLSSAFLSVEAATATTATAADNLESPSVTSYKK